MFAASATFFVTLSESNTNTLTCKVLNKGRLDTASASGNLLNQG